MTPQEALENAIEYFEQRDTSSASYWDFTSTTKQEIVIGLRQLIERSDAAGDEQPTKERT